MVNTSIMGCQSVAWRVNWGGVVGPAAGGGVRWGVGYRRGVGGGLTGGAGGGAVWVKRCYLTP